MIPRISINPGDWRAGSGDRAWLRSELLVNGLSLHLDAFEVVSEAAVQAAVGQIGEILGDVHQAVAADGPWQTLRIDGRDYVLIATPFC